MESEREFIAEHVEEPKPFRKYERQELVADESLFSAAARPLAKKHLLGKTLSSKERSLFDKELYAIWEDKYGFPYTNKAARYEVLMRKYAPAQERQEAVAMQEQLFTAFFKSGDTQKLSELKERYAREYLDQLEGVETLFNLVPFLEMQRKIDQSREKLTADERASAIEELTQYRFMITHFVWQNSGNKKFLERFWRTVELLAENVDKLRQIHQLRRSVVSQVAVLKVFEQLGSDPRLSHPKEDAFRAIDMWSDAETVVQVKGTHEGEPGIFESEAIAFPGVELEHAGEVYHYNSYEFMKMQEFATKVSSYEKVLQKKLKGYFVIVPYSKIDFVTGEPDAELVTALRERLRRG